MFHAHCLHGKQGGWCGRAAVEWDRGEDSKQACADMSKWCVYIVADMSKWCVYVVAARWQKVSLYEMETGQSFTIHKQITSAGPYTQHKINPQWIIDLSEKHKPTGLLEEL